MESLILNFLFFFFFVLDTSPLACSYISANPFLLSNRSSFNLVDFLIKSLYSTIFEFLTRGIINASNARSICKLMGSLIEYKFLTYCWTNLRMKSTSLFLFRTPYRALASSCWVVLMKQISNCCLINSTSNLGIKSSSICTFSRYLTKDSKSM